MNWQLEKTYFDLQSADGTALIGYRAAFGGRRLKLPYEAWLLKRPGRPAVLKQTVKSGALKVDDQGVEWRNNRLGIHGRWAGGPEAWPRLQADFPEGRIDWQVRGAAVPVRLNFGRGDWFQGLGYWENLKMTLPPWRLPFPELKWGRFLSDDASLWLVWVAWLGGPQEEKRLWSAQGELGALSFLGSGLTCRGGRLDFVTSEILRQGELFKSLGASAAVCSKLLPHGLGRTVEDKRLSRSRWLPEGGRAVEGWSIHETVYWR